MTDYGANQVHILTDDWTYVSFKTFNNPAYMIKVGTFLYMTGDSNVWKLDKNLNVLFQYNSTTPYRGIYYNSTNDLIYSAPYTLTAIHVINSNLTFNHMISTSPYSIHSIAEYNNQMYAGTSNGMMLVMVNEMIINTFNGCNGKIASIASMLFDMYGYLATSCFGTEHKLYLYYPNGIFAGKSLSTPASPQKFDFDSKGNFVQISQSQISIHN